MISQRELRNDNAEIMRELLAGETFTVTRHGVPVARLIPLNSQADLTCDRPAKQRPRYATQERVVPSRRTADLLDDLRGDR